jgi:hypothetical protein
MEIPLFEDDVDLKFDRIVLYPYPDMKRIWTRCWITAVQDEQPNVEIRVLNPNGSENTSVYLMAQSEQRVETTLHLRDPKPGATYRVVAELTVGISEHPEVRDVQEFDMVLEFRNPDANEPGFGMGVAWDELNSGAQG